MISEATAPAGHAVAPALRTRRSKFSTPTRLGLVVCIPLLRCTLNAPKKQQPQPSRSRRWWEPWSWSWSRSRSRSRSRSGKTRWCSHHDRASDGPRRSSPSLSPYERRRRCGDTAVARTIYCIGCVLGGRPRPSILSLVGSLIYIPHRRERG